MSNDHIPTEEIKQDIADTWAEVHDLERKEKGHRLIGDRMSMFRADGCRSGITERMDFIAKLGLILEQRGAK